MPTPNIVQGQIAIDPVNGILYYKTRFDNIVQTSLNLIQESASLITTPDSLEVAGDITIDGDLTVNGNTVTVNAETLLVEDNIIVLNSNTSGNPTLNAGIEIERGNLVNVLIRWNESSDKWEITNNGVDYFEIRDISTVLLDELSDVVISSPEEFQSLVYDGTNWVNKYASTVTYVRNVESNTLTTGTVVYLFGATGDHASVKRADNDSDVTSSKTVGIVAADISASQNGPVVTRGYVDGINLSTGYSAGDILWLGENGGFTKTKPSAPEHLVFVGVVVRATNNGIIYVATQNGYEIDELHDVSINSPTSGQILKYNGTVWVNDSGLNKYTTNIGNNTNSSFTVTHNLNTRDVIVNIYDNSTYQTVLGDVSRTTANTITVSFSSVPSSNAYTVVVIG